MRTTLPKSVALLAVALLCAPPAFAQVKSEPKPVPAKSPAPVAAPAAPKPPAPPVAPSPPGFSTIAPVPATPAGRRLPEVHIDGLPLRDAIALLHELLKEEKLEPMNILLAPDTHNLTVPEFRVRNVTGPDALQLIAAATGCTAEPMFSTDPTAPTTQTRPPGSSITGHYPPVVAYMLRPKPNASSAPPGMSPSMMMPAGRSASATSPSGRLTRIYPLGAVTTATKFPDVEKTIRDILKADGVAENQVSLALHEKTNVLVVNAGEQVHNLVEQLLTALNTNTSQVERLNTARDRAMGREELESAVRAQKRLAEELAERDALLRELQKELRKLQDAVQKPPSAK